jgi:hypothetical protein
MRAPCLLVAGSLALLVVSCGSGGGNVKPNDVTPVSKYKELLAGKWDADGENQLVRTYEFGPDNKAAMTLKGVPAAFQGTYSWTGDREVEIEYQASAEAKKDYAAAVKAHKDPQRKMAEGGGPIADAVKKSLDAIPDELPAKEKVKVILSEKPREMLILTLDGGLMLNFNRAK